MKLRNVLKMTLVMTLLTTSLIAEVKTETRKAKEGVEHNDYVVFFSVHKQTRNPDGTYSAEVLCKDQYDYWLTSKWAAGSGGNINDPEIKEQGYIHVFGKSCGEVVYNLYIKPDVYGIYNFENAKVPTEGYRVIRIDSSLHDKAIYDQKSVDSWNDSQLGWATLGASPRSPYSYSALNTRKSPKKDPTATYYGSMYVVKKEKSK